MDGMKHAREARVSRPIYTNITPKQIPRQYHWSHTPRCRSVNMSSFSIWICELLNMPHVFHSWWVFLKNRRIKSGYSIRSANSRRVQGPLSAQTAHRCHKPFDLGYVFTTQLTQALTQVLSLTWLLSTHKASFHPKSADSWCFQLWHKLKLDWGLHLVL